MEISLNKNSFGKFHSIEIYNRSIGTKVCLLNCGALLNNFQIKSGNNAVELINGYKNTDDLENNLSKNFKGVLLAPYANRVSNGHFNFNGHQELTKIWPEKSYAIHGFLFNKAFEITATAINEKYAEVTFGYQYNGDEKGFPFPFNTTIVYRLTKDSKLICNTIIENTGQGVMPVNIGWHPLFYNNLNINEVELQFNSVSKIDVDDELIPTGTTTAFFDFNALTKIGETVFDNCFVIENHQQALVILKDAKTKTLIELTFETGANKFNFLQLYTPPNRNSIAIEPMTGWPDAFNNKQGLILIAPQTKKMFQFEIKASTF